MKNVFDQKHLQTILSLFLEKNKLTFTDIEQALALRSNHASYYIKKLVTEGILEKQTEQYHLSKTAESLLPYLNILSQKERVKLPVIVLVIQNKQGRVAFLQRTKRPYAGYYALPGSKIRMHETVATAALRIAQEEAGLSIRHVQPCFVVDEHLFDQKQLKNSWLLFVIRAQTVDDANKDVRWFSLRDCTKEKCIPSDIWMLKQALRKRMKIPFIEMHEENERLTMTL